MLIGKISMAFNSALAELVTGASQNAEMAVLVESYFTCRIAPDVLLRA